MRQVVMEMSSVAPKKCLKGFFLSRCHKAFSAHTHTHTRARSSHKILTPRPNSRSMPAPSAHYFNQRERLLWELRIDVDNVNNRF